MIDDLPREFSSGRPAAAIRRAWRFGFVLGLGALILPAGHLPAADVQPPAGDGVPAAALRELAGARRLAGCLATPTDDLGQARVFRGRPSIQIRGREPGGDVDGRTSDLAEYDPAAGRIVSYVCFANASTRKSGEAILSLAEVSGRADKLARAILPGVNLDLEGVKRYRTDGTDAVYYEARYTPAPGEFPFLEPPVRLLFNASLGSLFRLDIDADWLDPDRPPRVMISKKSAERIAAVVLRGRDLAPALGAGSVFVKVAAAELFTVRPNDWLGFFSGSGEARARVAWVVPFRVEGGTAAGLHNFFVDAETGRILGGLPGRTAGQPPP